LCNVTLQLIGTIHKLQMKRRVVNGVPDVSAADPASPVGALLRGVQHLAIVAMNVELLFDLRTMLYNFLRP
jgi:hypothetical protein